MRSLALCLAGSVRGFPDSKFGAQPVIQTLLLPAVAAVPFGLEAGRGRGEGRWSRSIVNFCSGRRRALDEAVRQQGRASELTAFVQALRKTAPAELVRCAWCGKVAAGEEWIDPRTLLGGSLHERLRRNASHGICPDCLRQALAAAEQERARRDRA